MFVLSDKVGNPSINKPEGDSGDKGRKLTCASFVKYIKSLYSCDKTFGTYL